jgi:putative serine protease PepD
VLGVETLDVAAVDPSVAQRFSITATAGAFVQKVQQGSGAADAGLQAGDVIVEVDGSRIRTASDVGQAVRAKRVGDTVEVTIERQGEEQTVTATLGSS